MRALEAHMIHSCRNFLLIGFTLGFFRDGSLAVASPSAVPFSFLLRSEPECESGYVADNVSTKRLEHVCAAFDLTGLEAPAFQSGVTADLVGDLGEIRASWLLDSLVFNTDPRDLPIPAVSPFITFRFLRDELCASGYAGQPLNLANPERGCLMFDLDGFHGEAKYGERVQTNESMIWELTDIGFHVPAQWTGN